MFNTFHQEILSDISPAGGLNQNLASEESRVPVMSPLLLVQLLLLGFEVTGAATGSHTQCKDSAPVDFLSVLLESNGSKPSPGLLMKQAGGVRGVHLSRPHPPSHLPSSHLLVNCDLFHKEFSIVVTLKVSHIGAKKNEYIFSIIRPKGEEQEVVTDDGMKHLNTLKRSGKRRRKNHSDRGWIMLGMRFSRKRLHFLFKGPKESLEQWVFRGTRLADDQWHTLVLHVGVGRVRLTVDCGSPQEILPSKPFPSDINIHGSTLNIGSRGRWKGLFSGLLRQVLLVPGADVSLQMCPSAHPQLAALVTPHHLLDSRSHQTSLEQRVSLGLDTSCTELVKGQLWFSPTRKGLYLCDGTTWITVLEDRKRLDYVQEHQVLTTNSETHDVEVFQIPHMGLMAAMAHRSTSPGSAVYRWTEAGFQLYQNISTHGALAWRHFNVGKKMFLVVSNSGEQSDSPSHEESEEDFSVIYKWNKRRKAFVQFQTVKTHCARDWEAFVINQQTYLAVANHRIGNNNHTIDSVIYKWSKVSKSFEVHQTLQTLGAYDWEFFTVGPYHFLVVANAFDGVTTSVDSVIYVWVDGRFQVFQTIKTFCATDWEMFQIGQRVFLVVANGHRLHSNRPSRYAINSTIYELDMIGRLFLRFQDIVTYSAVDWEFFSLGEEHFLVVANSYNGESYSLNSVLYRWQGYEGFVPVHWLPTIGCSDWEFFSAKGESYLIYSSAKVPLSKVFKLKVY
ncbi:thrombospondin-type laminin G domain and EAR repeat-containing protein-like [Neosynchiropus ocellatus]